MSFKSNLPAGPPATPDRAPRWRQAANDAGHAPRPALPQDALESLEAYGFSSVTLIEITSRTDETRRRVLHDQRPNGWERVYAEHMHHLADPVVSELMRASDPFFWSELTLRRGRLTTAERRVLRDAERFGLREGFVAPRGGPNSTVEGLVFCGPRPIESGSAARGPLIEAAKRIFDQLPPSNRQRPRASSLSTPLRSRQLECLHWAAHGKTSAEIGLILSLSRKTVDEHIENACRTFGVNGRIQAVARAIDIGLIDLR